MKNINIGKVGNINDINGVKIYVFKDEIYGSIKMYNFDFIHEIQKDVSEILPNNHGLTYKNCIVGLDLFIEENYRKKGLAMKLLEESFIECKKYNMEYWLGYRKLENKISKKIFDNIGAKIICEDEKIEVVLKKI